MSNTWTRLALPFVVTVAIAPMGACKPASGTCEPPDCHRNPPPPEPAVVVEPTADPTATANATATADGSAAPSATMAAPEPTSPPDPVPKLRDAPAGAKVRVTSRGCFYSPPSGCPTYDPDNPVRCNPPRPQRVNCPDANDR